MSSRLRARIGSVIGLILLTVAAIGLYRMMRHHSVSDVLGNLGAIPMANLLLALLFVGLSYLVLTLYDLLALSYLHHPLPYRKIAMASFVSYALAHSMGVSVLAGGSVRYRLYSAWGLTTGQIAQVILFNTFTAGLGLLTVGGAALVAFPAHLPGHPFLLERGPQILGLVFLLLVCIYLLMSARHRGHIKLGKRDFAPPTIGISLLQIWICCLDIFCAGSVLYFLLPPDAHIPYLLFLGLYILAYIVGLLSQVPGGLGVFETGMIFLLKDYASPAAILGSLLAFRLLYYVLPLGIAVVWLGTHEFLSGTARPKDLV